MALTPNVLWAQTKDDLYLTVELSNASDLKVNVTDEAFKFHAKKDEKVYEFDFKFLKPVKSAEYKTKNERFVEFKVPKQESESWATLNSCGKKHYLKCNWDKWVDSDAEADDLNDGFDMPNFGDFGDLDMGAMDDEEEDAEDEEVERSEHCKNENCKCDPCLCTPESQCGGSKSAGNKLNGGCCDTCECEPAPAGEPCCGPNKCSEECPC